MTPEDIRLILSALLGIGVTIWLIVKGKLHPFIALLCGAFLVGLAAGLSAEDTAKAVQKGVGDILGGTGLVVALGLSLGAMLQLSNGASSIARAGLGLTGPTGAPWASLLVAMMVGLPLFFETGLVLLLPIVAAAAASLPAGPGRDAASLRLMLPALAGLSVVHALVPPHPGPLLAVNALGADLGRTILYGLIVAIPTAIVAGPLLSRFTSRGVRLDQPVLEPQLVLPGEPSRLASLTVILMPVVLIAMGQVHTLLPTEMSGGLGWLAVASNPVLALLLTNLVALPLLFGGRIRDAAVQGAIWSETMKPAGAILLAIGAGGALKQVLVGAGLSELLARLASSGAVSPILLSWLIAVGIRLATGSATVATITTAGIVPALVQATGTSPEWTVLAIGAGSVFFSHVNDPGFWLVKSYIGTSTADTFRTWSVLETAISVVGLLCILMASAVL
ncbi:gluconate:H+ symporter [Sphingomonas quercus]|uniref:GntP family permease n=1 Tax=Sphingomonas quercus TaxID=2842451 RepID=A0ABS6BMD2_9SPHN|nr:gluconate:H+ symporter [Sphingomonas quercus]MBU3079484.1 GntP family permease [Sphingomonas quercus]